MDPAPVTFRPNVAVDALPDYVGKPHRSHARDHAGRRSGGDTRAIALNGRASRTFRGYGGGRPSQRVTPFRSVGGMVWRALTTHTRGRSAIRGSDQPYVVAIGMSTVNGKETSTPGPRRPAGRGRPAELADAERNDAARRQAQVRSARGGLLSVIRAHSLRLGVTTIVASFAFVVPESGARHVARRAAGCVRAGSALPAGVTISGNGFASASPRQMIPTR